MLTPTTSASRTTWGASWPAHFQPANPKGPKSFLSCATWVVRDHRTWLRKQTAMLRIRAKHIGELASVRAWRCGKSLAAMWCRMLLMLCGEANEKADFVQQLRDTRKDLKQSLRKDRQKWLSELAQQASDMSVKDVVCRLRPLLRANSRRQHYRKTLPAVLLQKALSLVRRKKPGIVGSATSPPSREARGRQLRT